MSEHANVYHSVNTVENFREINREVQRFIEANFNNSNLGITDFVQAKGYSQRQVQRALAWQSTTWSRMLLDVRMRRAKELLSFSGESIETIIERVGYASVSQLERTFQAEEGMGLEEYRTWAVNQRQQ